MHVNATKEERPVLCRDAQTWRRVFGEISWGNNNKKGWLSLDHVQATMIQSVY